MSDNKSVDIGQVWWFWFTTSAFDVDKRLRRIFRILPHDPRCKFCNAPFRGVGGSIVRAVFGKQQSVLNPRFCNMCDEVMRRIPGGTEVEMSMLFVDVRARWRRTGVAQPGAKRDQRAGSGERDARVALRFCMGNSE